MKTVTQEKKNPHLRWIQNNEDDGLHEESKTKGNIAKRCVQEAHRYSWDNLL